MSINIHISCDPNVNYKRLVSAVEKISPISWVNYSNIDNLPFVDVILWSNCDLKTNLRNIQNIGKILKPGGKFYFNYTLQGLSDLIDSCITKVERLILFGSNDFINIQKILELIINDTELHGASIKYANTDFIVITRKELRFNPSADLLKTLEVADKAIIEPAETVPMSIQVAETVPMSIQVAETVPEVIQVAETVPVAIQQVETIPVAIQEVETVPVAIQEVETIPVAIQEVETVAESIQVAETVPEPENNGEILPETLHGFENKNNSCFMDSILFPLLLIPNDAITRLFSMDITPELIKENCSNVDNGVELLGTFVENLKSMREAILKGVNQNLVCLPLLSLIKKCNNVYEFEEGAEGDDGEFITAIFSMFGITLTQTTSTRELSMDNNTWVRTSSNVTREIMLEIYISPDMYPVADWYQSNTMNDYTSVNQNEWPMYEDKQWPYEKKSTIINDATMLIFHINRIKIINGEQTRVNDAVNFTEKIINKQTDEVLSLKIITVQIGDARAGHYISVFNYGDLWYEYNDIRPAGERVRKINIGQVLNNYSTGASLLIYMK